MFSFNIIDRYEEDSIKEIQYWKKDFNELIPEEDYDCVITPGNSFGIMDGGFDKVLLDRFPEVQSNVQMGIECLYGREMPLGTSLSCRLTKGVVLIYVPTMRFPGPVSDNAAAYNAALSAFSLIKQFNKRAPARALKRVVMPLLATNTGGIPPKFSAKQIVLAYQYLEGKPPAEWTTREMAEQQSKLMAATNFVNLRTGK